MACYNRFGRTNPRQEEAAATNYPVYQQPVAPTYNVEPDGRIDDGNIGASGTAWVPDSEAVIWSDPQAMPGNQQSSMQVQPLPAPAPLPVPQPMPTPEEEMPETLTEYIYTPGYLRAHIGRLMRVEFLVANNTTDRVGILEEVGASYIVLASLETGSRIMCDLYSIKFATIIENQLGEALDAGY